MSVYSKYNEFLSHPIEEDRHSLIEHLLRVAEKMEEILFGTGFYIKKVGYYTGLLHDIGKLNPYYQDLFNVDKRIRESKEKELISKYQNSHSPLSSWVAFNILDNTTSKIDYKTLDKIIHVIYGHHTILRKSVPNADTIENNRFQLSKKMMLKNLEVFYDQIKDKKEFSDLNWNKCFKQFSKRMNLHQIELISNENDHVRDFLQISMWYSALLQADRGSFNNWTTPVFDIEIETSKLIKKESKLSELRTKFQSEAINNYDFELNMCILEAPTGIGKTKVFLDLIDKFRKNNKSNKLERVFYFSPLLALTEDFEKKIQMTINEKENVLIYNHLFAGSIAEKDQKESGMLGEQHWLFEYESFNTKFIITTTQRLLITLYSNSQSDKLKLASFKNSLLIIDEVQTIPKFMLPNLINILKELGKNIGTKILLVSATIPHELNSISKINISKDIINDYLVETQKQITFIENLAIPEFKDKKVLIMGNTRRKIVKIFQDILNKFCNSEELKDYNDKIFYISSGIKKKDRVKIIEAINNANKKDNKNTNDDSCLVVSTQVIEAGVDISFSEIYREVAPLDSIVQVMGRLNREGSQNDAMLSIFQQQDHRPYSELEFNESLKILKKIKSSNELYDNLYNYYRTISEQNKIDENNSQTITKYMIEMDFVKIWEFVNNKVMPDDGDNVFIPESREQWNILKREFTKSERISKNVYKNFIGLTASLPRSVKIKEIEHLFDEELFEKKILLPKFEFLDKIYDKKMGLDKWLMEE